MIKQTRIHLLLLASLAVMVVGLLGVGLYQSCCEERMVTCQAAVEAPEQSTASTLQKSIPESTPKVQTSSAKAFGIVAPKTRYISCKSVKELDSVFMKCGVDLKKAKKEGKIPRVYLAQFPRDMTKKRKAGKSTFIRALLPLILQVNEKILADRARLLALQKRQEMGGHLRQSEKKWLCTLAKKYRCKSTKITSLLIHVDIVPPSLALAQATLESGWGKSSAALSKNSTFGHMKTKTSVAKFESLLANVEAYILNLNRHKAYKKFRTLRASMRGSKKEKLCSTSLAEGLWNYSVRKGAYIKQVQYIIRTQELEGYDHIKLEKHPEI